MNQVQQFLKKNHMGVAALARLISTPTKTISRQRIQYHLKKGKYWPPHLSLILEKGTGGKIKASRLILGK